MNRRGICENKQKVILIVFGEGEGEVVRESGSVVMGWGNGVLLVKIGYQGKEASLERQDGFSLGEKEFKKFEVIVYILVLQDQLFEEGQEEVRKLEGYQQAVFEISQVLQVFVKGNLILRGRFVLYIEKIGVLSFKFRSRF